MIGYFGKVKFKVSDNMVHSFRDFKRSVKGNWKEHELYKRKPFSEYLGAGQQSITFQMDLETSLGVNPYKLMESWNSIIENGKHDILVIGDNQIGRYEWKVTGADEDWKYLLSNGKLVSASINITMTEYCNNPGRASKSSQSNKGKKSKTVTKSTLKTAKSSSYVIGARYEVYCNLTGYFTSMEAKNLHATNRTGTVKKGNYYVYNAKDGMINLTSVKGVPGSWINPSLNKR